VTLRARWAMLRARWDVVPQAAARNGTAPFDPSELVDPSMINDMDPKDLLIITTGSQAEPQAMLGQAARGAFRDPPPFSHRRRASAAERRPWPLRSLSLTRTLARGGA
jgi:hypothetical protein